MGNVEEADDELSFDDSITTKSFDTGDDKVILVHSKVPIGEVSVNKMVRRS